MYWTYPLPCLALLLLLAGFLICIDGIYFIEACTTQSDTPVVGGPWLNGPLDAGEFIMALGVAVLILAYHTVKRDQNASAARDAAALTVTDDAGSAPPQEEIDAAD